MSVDALGNPLRYLLTGGQEHDIAWAGELIVGYESEYVIADKGYDAQPFRESIPGAGHDPGYPAPFQPEGTARI